jgi:hypothetical protein
MQKKDNPLQLRVVFHCERLFFGQPKAHAAYVAGVRALGLDPANPGSWSDLQCVSLLQLIETVCRAQRMWHMRDCRTGWEDIAINISLGRPPIFGMPPEKDRV